ncbi:hypothetical protein U0070_005561 [Myodes glareolus]|uniref:Uncharacterized protein n=1 Tax=Myodes glareolus TaxID=447135 RepID=A0AAW0IUP4_MYOGA
MRYAAVDLSGTVGIIQTVLWQSWMKSEVIGWKNKMKWEKLEQMNGQTWLGDRIGPSFKDSHGRNGQIGSFTSLFKR